MKFTLRTIMLTIASLVALSATAYAGTSQDIIRDARDGSIDGDYTLAELRAADSAISAEVREYNLWDEVYAVAVARAGNKNAPKPKVVKATDRDGNGTIDPDERAEAAKETRNLNQQLIKKHDKPRTMTAAGDTTETTDTTDTVTASKSSDKDDDGGASWPLIVLIAAIIVIGLVGVWRVIVTRKKPGGGGGSNEGAGPRR